MRFLLLFLIPKSFINGAYFIVDSDLGDDDNNGVSTEKPFKTIQHCVDNLAEAGDSCNIRAGRYHEEVNSGRFFCILVIPEREAQIYRKATQLQNMFSTLDQVHCQKSSHYSLRQLKLHVDTQVFINGLRGSEQRPLVIRGFQDERPIWDGSVPIQPKEWDFDSKTGICSAAIEEDIFALLLDDQLLTPARWPNALWEDKTVFDNRY